MLNTFITHLQIFGVGVMLGAAGPCLLVCAPAILAYTAGTKKGWGEMLGDIAGFLSGRTLAYVTLGYLAGLSGAVLRQFAGSASSAFFKPASGVLSIILGLLVLFHKDVDPCGCKKGYGNAGSLGGVVIFGFLIGITPCVPLMALLFEIVLMSRNAFEGASYAFSFGLGTAVSGLVIMAVLASALSWFPAKALKSETGKRIFRTVCAVLLMALGLSIII